MTRWFLAPILLAASPSIAAADDPIACHAPAADTKLALSFRPDISIGDLTAWITGVTCKNVVYDATIAKRAIKVTIVAPNKYTPKQALELVIDAIESTGLVVVQKPDTLVIKLGPGMPKACPDIAAAPELSKDPAPTPDPDAVALAAKLDAGIKKLDDTHYELKQALVDDFMANPMAVMKGARVVPAMKNGKPEGIKLYAIRPFSAYTKLGLANGDTVAAINKLPLTSVDATLDIYTKLRTAKRFEVELIRRGKPLTIVITIK